jgi:hypothetical protein
MTPSGELDKAGTVRSPAQLLKVAMNTCHTRCILIAHRYAIVSPNSAHVTYVTRFLRSALVSYASIAPIQVLETSAQPDSTDALLCRFGKLSVPATATAAVSAAAMSAAAMSAAFVSAAAVEATAMCNVEAAFVSTFVSTVETPIEAAMEAPVEVAEIVRSIDEDTANIRAAIVAAVVAIVHRFNRAAAGHYQTRSSQASNDHLAAVGRGPPTEGAVARNCKNRFKKNVFHR